MNNDILDYKQNFYIDKSLLFKNYINLTIQESIEVLKYRNDISVRKWMLSKKIIKNQEHLDFIEKLKQNNNSFYWAIYKDNEFIGAISVVNVHNAQANPGIFLNYKYIGCGIGVYIAYQAINFLFEHLKLDQLVTFVNEENKAAISMNTFLGYSLIEKSGAFLKIALTKDVWNKKKEKIKLLINKI